QSPAGFPPGSARVVRDEERRLRVDEADDRRAGRRGGEDPRDRDRDLRRGFGRGVGGNRQNRLVLQVAGDPSLPRLHVGDQRSLPESRSATSELARPAAGTGACPAVRAARYATVKASPAPVGSTPAEAARAGTSVARPPAKTRQPREPSVTR